MTDKIRDFEMNETIKDSINNLTNWLTPEFYEENAEELDALVREIGIYTGGNDE